MGDITMMEYNYNSEILSKYPYFAEEMKSHEISEILDSLTGLISRPFIIGFVKWMIEHNQPFTYGMLDLDNFKFINDTYGHKVGDGVLTDVSAGLRSYIGEVGLAGRFGGDELLFVNLQDLNYDEKKHFLEGMYFNYKVLRKNVNLGTCEPFITGTIGCATYPEDAQDYDGMFALIDKTLYRGKNKGRNCYIIYVEEKHKNLEISTIAKEGIYHTFHRLALQFDLLPNIRSKLLAAYDTLQNELRITNLYYVGEDKKLRSLEDPDMCLDASDIDELMVEDMYAAYGPNEIKKYSPEFYKTVLEANIETILIMRVAVDMHGFGYLICGEPANTRIWQEDEKAILFFAARMLAGSLARNGQKL